jgi:hypothetical protein
MKITNKMELPKRKLNLYKVQAVTDYANQAPSLDYDYTKDFETLVKIRGYINLKYYVTDSELEVGKVYFNGDIIKVLELVTSFEGESPQLMCIDVVEENKLIQMPGTEGDWNKKIGIAKK